MRKLASIQKILNLEHIEGADAIEKATILGWSVVVKKGEFSIGDLCVYVEIDSILPDKPEFEFIKKGNSKMRIKTIRLRGQISQGICFPITILPHNMDIEEDMDVTDVLEIIKYEPEIPACLAGMAKGNFPSFIPKSDETRIQVLQKLLDKYEGQLFYETEKLDGSSSTFYINDGIFGVCSRNIDLKETEENTYWKVARVLDVENKLRSLNQNIALQGELIGEGIQKNKYKLKGHTVKFFRAFDINKGMFLDYNNFIELMCNLGLETVPISDQMFTLINDIPTLVEMSQRKSKINPDVWVEGFVYVPETETIDTGIKGLSDNHVSFKVINPKFLLKYDE